MAKKMATKKRSVRKAKTPKPPTRKAGSRIKIKPDKALLKRLAELGVSTMVVDECCLQISLELDRKHRPAEMAFLLDAAVVALRLLPSNPTIRTIGYEPPAGRQGWLRPLVFRSAPLFRFL